jgi:hypothetical protein
MTEHSEICAALAFPVWILSVDRSLVSGGNWARS